jgi:sugar phosphate isomerase/epimerase
LKFFITSIIFLFFTSTLEAQSFTPKFFCFEDAFLEYHTNDPVFQANLIKKLGFDGMEIMGLDGIEEKTAALDKAALQLFMVYIAIDLDSRTPYDSRLFDFIKKMDHKGVSLWLHILSKKIPSSDGAGDAFCVPIIQQIADMAIQHGVKIALYPHTGFWLENIDDSYRVAEKVNRRNVGAVFNLCHYLKVDDNLKLEEKLTRVMPLLSAVSINGADDGETNQMEWDRLIQPLGDGSFNVLSVLQILKKNHYAGPIGLQCYGIKGNPEDFLARSMQRWKYFTTEGLKD